MLETYAINTQKKILTRGLRLLNFDVDGSKFTNMLKSMKVEKFKWNI